ncbi:MAG: DUF2911 domain-containing protein [Ferruginibacter sp.]
MMRFLLICTIFLLFTFSAHSQSLGPSLDKSPMDMSYYPNNYPLLKIQDNITGPAVARVIYSRPNKNGRIIFGELIEYGKVWRLGANEATEIEFYQNVKIGSTKVKKGTYTMYAIPATDKWTIIVNKETDTWGSFKYDIKKDLLRIDLPVEKQSEVAESFVMFFDKATNGISLQIIWDDIKVSLPISL